MGKTSLINQYTLEIYNPYENSTIGLDFKMKYIEVDGKIVKLMIWDTAR